MLRVVVVLLGLDSGIRRRFDRHVQADVRAGLSHQISELADRELLCELVEHAELALVGRVQDGQLDAAQRVSDVQVTPRLATFAVDGEGVADHRLHAEPVQRRSEHLVVVEAGGQPFVQHGLRRFDAIDNTLVQVGGAQPPYARREVDVRRVVDLRAVVQRAGQFRKRQSVAAAVPRDLQISLFDIDVGCPVLAHRSKLHKVRVRCQVAHGKQHVQGADDVVYLGVDGVRTARHRVRSAGLLGVVHDRLRFELTEDALDDRVVGQVTCGMGDLATSDLLPGRQAIVEAPDRRQGVRAIDGVHGTAQVIVDRVYIVAQRRKTHRRWPAEIAVRAKDNHTHIVAPVSRGCELIQPFETSDERSIGDVRRRPVRAVRHRSAACAVDEFASQLRGVCQPRSAPCHGFAGVSSCNEPISRRDVKTARLECRS